MSQLKLKKDKITVPAGSLKSSAYVFAIDDDIFDER